MTKHLRLEASFLLLAGLAALGWRGAPGQGGGELALELDKLNRLGAVLYVAAHPDDENTALLTYLSKGRGVRAAYLSITRGDGGQNLIGDEKGPFLGILRTQELLAARRIDGAEQFFTRAVDFGYSKSPEETFRIWGKDKILADVVWVIRKFRPDVIVTRFPTTGEGGHGHHTASAILAEEAFAAAADPKRFPEQLEFMKPWQPKRLLWNVFRPPGAGARSSGPGGSLDIDLGGFSPILGKSFTEIAGESRSQHKSQGFGAPERRGSRMDGFQHIAGEPASGDLLDGVDTTWRRLQGGAKTGELLAKAAKEFDAREPAKSLPTLVEAFDAISHMPADPWVDVKQRDLLRAIQGCAGMTLEALAPAATACPGQTVDVQAVALNRSAFPITLERVDMPYGSTPVEPKAALEFNKPLTTKVGLRIGETWPFHEVGSQEKELASIDDAEMRGRLTLPEPFTGPVIWFVLKMGESRLRYEVPVTYRTVDPVKGEMNRPLAIVPPITMEPIEGPQVLVSPIRREMDGQIAVIPTSQASVRLRMKAWEPFESAKLAVIATPDWNVRLDVSNEFFEMKNSSKVMTTLEVGRHKAGDEFEYFLFAHPDKAGRIESGTTESRLGTATAYFTIGNQIFKESIRTIDYSHITPQTLFIPSSIDFLAVDAQCAATNIGYLAGSGDTTLDALRGLGCKVTVLSDEDIAEKLVSPADFDKKPNFDAIVVGVRAFNTHPKLKNLHGKLMEYVEKGGTLVVQYNTLQELATREIGPFPFDISRDRVTVEEAPVTFADPKHSILHYPNEITAKDFEGWVQERGLYFPNKWDERYAAPLSMADPGERATKGALLVANHGKGVFIYTGLSFFRQLPAGVPGAYRLFANLVSARQSPGAAQNGNGAK